MVLRRASGLVAVMVVLAGLSLCVDGLAAGLLHLAPALALATCLLGGRYLGEERLATLAAGAGSDRGPWPRTSGLDRLLRAPRASVRRGGALIAVSLGRRGPPVAARLVR